MKYPYLELLELLNFFFQCVENLYHELRFQFVWSQKITKFISSIVA